MYFINRILAIIIGCIMLLIGFVGTVFGHKSPTATYGEFVDFIMDNYIMKFPGGNK